MKHYKNLIPILLIVLMGAGIYNTYTMAAQKQMQIQENLALARENRDKGIIQDALTYYEAVMKLEKNFLVELEVGEMLHNAELLNEAVKWGEHLTDKYPKEMEGYSFLLAQYIADQDYEACFQLNDKAVNNKCVNKEFQKLMAQIDYQFDYGYDQFEDVTTFSMGMMAAMAEDKWKLLNDKGSPLASGFQAAGLYNGEVFPVRLKNEWCYVTSDGKKKIDVSKLKKCQELGVLREGIFKAKCSGSYGYYNTELKQVAGGFDEASSMNEGLGAVRSKKEWKILDSQGKQVGKTYQNVVINARDAACQNGRIWVTEDGESYYMIDSEGKTVKGESVEDSKGFTMPNSYAAVKKDGKWGFMDENGKMVIEPQFEDARSFCNDYAAVAQDGEWGFINSKGTIVIEPQFTETKDFSSGNVFVKRGEKWVLLKLYRNNY